MTKLCRCLRSNSPEPKYVEAQFNLGVALYKSALHGAHDPEAVAVRHAFPSI